MSSLKAALYVETIAGIGHMAVAAHLSQSLLRRGIEVYVLCSPHSQSQSHLYDFEGVHWCPLPDFMKDPTTGKATFSDRGVRYQEDLDFQSRRSQSLIAYLDHIKPNVLVTETWPLGKGHYDNELIPVLDHLKAQNNQGLRIFSLGRDIMHYPNHRGDMDSDKRAIEILNQYYDGLIITGDKSCFPIEESLRHTDSIEVGTHYVGYFASELPPTDNVERNSDVLAATGGGYIPDHYYQLIRDVILARKDSVHADVLWRILISPAYPEAVQDALKDLAKKEARNGGIVIEGLRDDFRSLLPSAQGFITTGGLNSMVDAFQASVHSPLPMVISPILTSKEQMQRAARLRALGHAGSYTQLGHPDILASTYNEQVRLAPSKVVPKVSTQGAEVAAEFIVNSIQDTGRSGAKPEPLRAC